MAIVIYPLAIVIHFVVSKMDLQASKLAYLLNFLSLLDLTMAKLDLMVNKLHMTELINFLLMKNLNLVLKLVIAVLNLDCKLDLLVNKLKILIYRKMG